MKAVIMAGGRASRFASPIEKATLVVRGRSLLERAVDALRVDGIDEVTVTISENTPSTLVLAEELGVSSMDTGGNGYHEDTAVLLDALGEFLSLNVDVVFANRGHVKALLSGGHGGSVAGVIPSSISLRPWDRSSAMGADSGEEMLWVGLNIVTGEPTTSTFRMDDPLLSINVNDEDDLAFAESIARDRGL